MFKRIRQVLSWNKEIKLLQQKIDELQLYIDNLLHEKHEMILADRKDIAELQTYTQSLFHEKHEMILTDRKDIAELRVRTQNLFHEKHEMILADRKEICELVKNNILQFYKENRLGDKKDEINFLRENPLSMYPYDWIKEYENMTVECQQEDGWLYVIHHEKKIFFPQKYTEGQVKQYYRFLIMEQDKRSPHFYGIKENILPQTVFVDVGAAEGLISLEIIEKVKEVYIFESDTAWVNALKKTFKEYENKVYIIEKFAGDVTAGKKICLCDVLLEKNVYIIKIDVEGHEAEVLRGMHGINMEQGSCLMICCYHNQKDEEIITNYLKRQEMNYSFAEGYVLSTWGGDIRNRILDVVFVEHIVFQKIKY